MDTRPADTENAINVRSRIRLCSFLSLLCVFVYVTIQESFSGAHVSYLHLIHLFVQPVVLFVSLLEFSSFPQALAWTHLALLLSDAFVAVLSFISVSRCFSESTATCFERLYEKGTWFVLACVLCVLDLIISMQLSLLHVHMEEKDIHEKAEVERLKNTNEAPSWNTVTVCKNKSDVLCMFMLPLDVAYIVCMFSMLETLPIYYLSVGHIFLDPFFLWTDGGFDVTYYKIMRGSYMTLFAFNTLLMIIQLQITIDNVSKMLALLISVLYIVTDLNHIVYTTQIVDTIKKYETFKRNI